jgi:hypothetical protein
MKKKMKRMNMGGLPSQANSMAAVGMARRPAMPSQAMKKGGKVKRMAYGGLPEQANAMATSKVPGTMGNPRGMGTQARAMAQAPNRTGGIGQQMSALARAQNRPAPMAPAAVPPVTAKAGGMMMGKDAAVAAKAQAQNGPSWKPAKGAGNYGKAVSAAAHARNAARKAAMPAKAAKPVSAPQPATPASPATSAMKRVKPWASTMSSMFPKTMKSGGMVRGAGCAKRGVKHSAKMG